MSQTANLWQQQCKIMDRFNFEKVQRTMLALGWRWRGEDPTLEQIKGTAEMLINHVTRAIEEGWESPFLSTSTGGFKASGHLINGNWILSLEFIVAQEDGHYI